MIDIIIPEHESPLFEEFGKKLGYEKIYVIGKNLRRDQIQNCANQPEKTRHTVEKSNVKIVYNLEVHHEKDGLHQRKSGFNHILAKIAQEKGKIIAFNFNTILSTSGSQRSILLGRMRQNVRLCRKYKTQMLLMSGSTHPYEMRAAQDMRAFGELIGMTPGESKRALTPQI